jgi:hypothetical protein
MALVDVIERPNREMANWAIVFTAFARAGDLLRLQFCPGAECLRRGAWPQDIRNKTFGVQPSAFSLRATIQEQDR